MYGKKSTSESQIFYSGILTNRTT